MAQAPGLVVPIAVEYDPKGMNQAQKGIKGFQSAISGLGISTKLTFAGLTYATTKYASSAVKAFIAEEKSAKSLTTTLKALGLGFQTTAVTQFIEQIQRTQGVTEEELRPAFQQLLTVTENVRQAQEGLNLALAVSRGSTKSLAQVSAALSRAYNGDTTALGKLNIGLDKNLLLSGNMIEITNELNRVFAGQATSAAETYAATINKISIASQEASEKIGKSLVEAIVLLSGDRGVQKLTSQIDDFGTSTAYAVDAVAALLDKVKPIAKFLGSMASLDLSDPFNVFQDGKANQGFIPFLADIGKGLEKNKKASIDSAKAWSLGMQENAMKSRNAAKAIAASNKEKEKNIELNKKTAAQRKLEEMFNQDAISLAVALRNAQTDEEKARVKALMAIRSESSKDDENALQKLIDLDNARTVQFTSNRAKEVAANAAAIAEQITQQTALNTWLKNNPVKYYSTFEMNGKQVVVPESFGVPQGPGSPQMDKGALDEINFNSMPNGPYMDYIDQSGRKISGPSDLFGGEGMNITINAGMITTAEKLAQDFQNQLYIAQRFGMPLTYAGAING